MIPNQNVKFGVVLMFGVVYFISFWLLTIGYFTPYWLLVDLTSGAFDDAWNTLRPWNLRSLPLTNFSCNSVGLVKPTHNCDSTIIHWFEENNIHDIGHILKRGFILMTTAVVVVYTNAIMLCVAAMFDLMQYSLFNSLLSISFGVFYPVAAILILVATIYVEAQYRSDTGYSPMLCTVAGCLMLFFYIWLIVYDQYFLRNNSKPKGNVKKFRYGTPEHDVKEPRHTQPLTKRHSRDVARLHSGKVMTSFESRGRVEPIRNWTIRRI